jgi:hypothetical protein
MYSVKRTQREVRDEGKKGTTETFLRTAGKGPPDIRSNHHAAMVYCESPIDRPFVLCCLLFLYARRGQGRARAAPELGGSRPRLTERRGQRRARERSQKNTLDRPSWPVLANSRVYASTTGGGDRRGPHKTREIGDMSHHGSRGDPFWSMWATRTRLLLQPAHPIPVLPSCPSKPPARTAIPWAPPRRVALIAVAG